MFRNLMLYRFSEWARPDTHTVEKAFADFPLPKLGALERADHGWVSPYGDDETMSIQQGCDWLACMGVAEKLLPSSVIHGALQERVRDFEAEHGWRPGGKVRRALREQVMDELLPQAFVRQSRVLVYLNLQDGWLAVDTTSRKTAERAVSLLRDTFGSFAALPLPSLYEESPSVTLSRWMSAQCAPTSVTLGDECQLVDPSSRGGVISARHEDLSSEEIVELLRTGKHVTRLGLVLDHRLSFVLDHQLVVRRLRLLDVPDDCEPAEDEKTELLARFAVAASDIRRVTSFLAKTFGVSRPTL